MTNARKIYNELNEANKAIVRNEFIRCTINLKTNRPITVAGFYHILDRDKLKSDHLSLLSTLLNVGMPELINEDAAVTILKPSLKK